MNNAKLVHKKNKKFKSYTSGHNKVVKKNNNKNVSNHKINELETKKNELSVPVSVRYQLPKKI